MKDNKSYFSVPIILFIITILLFPIIFGTLICLLSSGVGNKALKALIKAKLGLIIGNNCSFFLVFLTLGFWFYFTILMTQKLKNAGCNQAVTVSDLINGYQNDKGTEWISMGLQGDINISNTFFKEYTEVVNDATKKQQTDSSIDSVLQGNLKQSATDYEQKITQFAEFSKNQIFSSCNSDPTAPKKQASSEHFHQLGEQLTTPNSEKRNQLISLTQNTTAILGLLNTLSTLDNDQDLITMNDAFVSEFEKVIKIFESTDNNFNDRLLYQEAPIMYIIFGVILVLYTFIVFLSYNTYTYLMFKVGRFSNYNRICCSLLCLQNVAVLIISIIGLLFCSFSIGSFQTCKLVHEEIHNRTVLRQNTSIEAELTDIMNTCYFKDKDYGLVELVEKDTSSTKAQQLVSLHGLAALPSDTDTSFGSNLEVIPKTFNETEIQVYKNLLRNDSLKGEPQHIFQDNFATLNNLTKELDVNDCFQPKESNGVVCQQGCNIEDTFQAPKMSNEEKSCLVLGGDSFESVYPRYIPFGNSSKAREIDKRFKILNECIKEYQKGVQDIENNFGETIAGESTKVIQALKASEQPLRNVKTVLRNTTALVSEVGNPLECSRLQSGFNSSYNEICGDEGYIEYFTMQSIVLSVFVVLFMVALNIGICMQIMLQVSDKIEVADHLQDKGTKVIDMKEIMI